MQRFLLITFVLTLSTFLKAQGVKNPEDDVYVKLVEQFYQSDIIEDKIVISDSILRISKNSLDTLHMVAGYYLKAEIFDDDLVIQYCDSIIAILEGRPTYWQPSSTYILKGNYYYRNNNYNQALNEFIQSHKFNLAQNNSTLKNYTDYYIGILKIRLEEYSEAKSILSSNLEAMVLEDGEIPNTTKYSHWFGIGYSYSMLGDLDSSNLYIDKGLRETLEDTTSKSRANFLLVKGINYYLKEDYAVATDQLAIAKVKLRETRNSPNLAAAFYYSGLAKLKGSEDFTWVQEFEKMDSIIQNPNYVLPQLRPAYEHLIDYFEAQRNDSIVLYNIKRLITFDSINSKRNMRLSKNISEGYELPIFLEKRNKIINNLNKKAVVQNTLLWACGLLIIILVMIALHLNRLKRRNDLRYQEIMKAKMEDSTKLSRLRSSTNNNEIKNRSKVKIPSNVRQSILKELESFEKNKEYLEKDLTLSKLATKFNHNSKYISIVVKEDLEVAFIHYINDLRINYTIEKLQNDDVFIKYTLNAIANEVGFKQVESFNKAFFRVAGGV